jgi:hypothetical protein
LLGVVELAKPTDQWCPHCVKPQGCAIYHERPPTCVDFECGWLLSDLPTEFRPDRLHMIVTGESAELDAVVVHVDPDYRDAPYSRNGQRLLKAIRRVKPAAVLVTGGKRAVLTDDPRIAAKVQAAVDRLERHPLETPPPRF